MKVSYRIFEVQQQSRSTNFPWRFHGYAFQTQANPATPVRDLHAEHPPRGQRRGRRGLRLAPERRAEGDAEQVIDVINEAARRGIVPTSFSFDPVIADAPRA